jgi:hypothetical protein
MNVSDQVRLNVENKLAEIRMDKNDRLKKRKVVQ